MLKALSGTTLPAWKAFFGAHPEVLERGGSIQASEELKEEILREELRKIKDCNDRADGLYLLKSEIDAWLTDICEKIKAILSNKLKNELPPKLEGLRAPEISAKMEPIIFQIIELLRTAPSDGPDRADESDASDK